MASVTASGWRLARGAMRAPNTSARWMRRAICCASPSASSGPARRWWCCATASSQSGSVTPRLRSCAQERSLWVSMAWICSDVSGCVCSASWSCSAVMATFIESAAQPTVRTRASGQASVSRATSMAMHDTSRAWVAL